MQCTENQNFGVLDGELVKRGDAEPADPFLISRFEPNLLPESSVIRARLLDRITQGVLQTPLTLISAPAGAGKTVLAASWAKSPSIPWPVAWLTVDDANESPALFWPYVVETFAHAGVRLPQVERAHFDAETATLFFTRLAAGLLDQPMPAVLIVDGADRLAGRSVTAGLDFLIRHAYPQFRLVMCTRADPLLPLHRYRLADSLTELRLDDLAFSASEARELLARHGVRASREVATGLTDRTEGWAAGLRLAASSLRQGADPKQLIKSLAQDDGNVAEYLFAEVLDAQPPHVRQTLLRTSIAASISPELADLLTGRTDGRRTLAMLAHANAFIEGPAPSSGLYRLHPLFREMLQAQLRYESPAEVPELQRRCAKWLASMGQYLAAAEHARAGGDWAYVESLLIERLAVGSILSCDTNPYAAVLDSMPPDLAGDGAAVLRAATALSRDDVPSEADRARIVLLLEGLPRKTGDENSPTTASSLALRVSAAVVYASFTALRHADAAQAVMATDYARSLINELPVEQRSEHSDLSAVLQATRASALLHTTTERAAAQALETAIAASVAAGSSRLQRKCLGELALVEAVSGSLRRATELAQEAESLADQHGLAGNQRLPAAPLALAWVQSEEYNHIGARRWSARIRVSLADDDDRLIRPLQAVLQARLLRSRSDVELARKLLETYVDVDAPCWVKERVLIDSANLDLAQEQPERALTRVDALPDQQTRHAEILRDRITSLVAIPTSPTDATKLAQPIAPDAEAPLSTQVDVWIDEAARQLEQNQVSEAAVALERALTLARPERLRRPFIDSSPQLRKLLRADHRLRSAAAWLSPAPAARKPHQPATAAPRLIPNNAALQAKLAANTPVEALSEREMQVLRHLSDLLSTEEIGAALFVSVNTVRTHVRSILRKLAVRRRNEAVRRARELNLI